jgi:hypothetical protein
MGTRHVALLTGWVLLAVAGATEAHGEGRYVVRPSNLSGSVTMFGGSHGPAGWAGALTFGAPVVIGAGVLPVAAIPLHYAHGPHCRHAYAVAPGYGRPWDYVNGHKHHPGRGHGHGHGHGNSHRH